MKFIYSKNNLSRREARTQRLFEILPGLVSWGILLGLCVLSLTFPLLASIIIIAFIFYWLLRLFYMVIFLVLSFLRLKIEKATDWMDRIQGIDRLEDYLPRLAHVPPGASPLRRLSDHMAHRALERLQKSGQTPPPSGVLHHLVIIPVAKEPLDVIEPGLRSMSDQTFDAQRILVVLAVEARAPRDIQEQARQLQKRYRPAFMDVLLVLHPDGIPGEARVKGANATWAARQAAEFLSQRNIPFEHTIVSCFDADTVVSSDYFACLTYYFMITPERLRASFQPIPLYNNNIWEVPGFARVIEAGASFFQLIEASNPDRLVTFSSHSMSFRALVDVAYWPVDMISDDSAIFWKAYVHFDGNYRVVPMATTLSMDVAGSTHFWKTAWSVYKQKRRWAWGVENFPLVMRAFLRESRIPAKERWRHGFKLFAGHIAWSTWGFLLTILCWMPMTFARQEFLNSVAYYIAPRITGTIFNLASVSLVISIVLSMMMLPRRTTRHHLWQRLGFALEWLMVPFILLLFSALPALDAQTRLMAGRYLEFWVSDKTRIPRGEPTAGARPRTPAG